MRSNSPLFCIALEDYHAKNLPVARFARTLSDFATFYFHFVLQRCYLSRPKDCFIFANTFRETWKRVSFFCQLYAPIRAFCGFFLSYLILWSLKVYSNKLIYSYVYFAIKDPGTTFYSWNAFQQNVCDDSSAKFIWSHMKFQSNPLIYNVLLNRGSK